MLKIQAFLLGLTQKDWVSFNLIDDALKQSELYNDLLDKFRKLVEMGAEKDHFDFRKLYELIKSYHDDFSAFPFMGKFYAVVNPHLLTGQLSEISKEIAFSKEKDKLQILICDCEIRDRYEQQPNKKDLIKISHGCDGYYNYFIFQCSKCSFKWSSYQLDDSSGRTVFKKWSEEEFPE